MNVSKIGDHSGGKVGLKFPNWNVQVGWDSVIIPNGIEHLFEPGQYTYTVTFTGQEMIDNSNWLRANLYWTANLDDPWNNYDLLADIGNDRRFPDWVRLDRRDNGEWQTHVVDFRWLFHTLDPSPELQWQHNPLRSNSGKTQSRPRTGHHAFVWHRSIGTCGVQEKI
jgi:hypothetical protein